MKNRSTHLRRAALRGALFVCVASLGAARAEDGYARETLNGLALLRAGDPAGAAVALGRAIRYDANDPTAWITFGAVLLDTSNVTAARGCFQRAGRLDPSSPHAPLGLALCAMADGKNGDPARLLAQSASRGSGAASALATYLDALNGRQFQPPAASGAFSSALTAFAARKSGAEPDWGSALPLTFAPVHWPLTASFDAKRPLEIRWQSNPRIQRPPREPVEAVSGSSVLKAPGSSALATASFDIDGSLASFTNVSPFEWTWDTGQWPDGWHFVHATAVTTSGSTVTRDRWVATSNAHKSPPRAYPELKDVAVLLDQALAVQPDVRYLHFALAKSALAQRRPEDARAQLEDVVAEDPRYLDAAHLLRGLSAAARPLEIWRGDRASKRVALTFDDGPDPRHTPQLLDVLDRLKIPATFFVVGKQAAAYPDTIKRMARAGYEIENHTWNHRNLNRLSAADALRELASTKRLIAGLTGAPTRYFRPPGGNIGKAAHLAGRALGLPAVMWTFASGKSEGLPLEDMVPRFVHAAKPGSIYLIHNGTEKIEELLPLVVQALHARGYEFVRLDALAP
ncbi:MAG TPA: polysaccharide deacetylase family protein [Armatimonadota bacterium]